MVIACDVCFNLLQNEKRKKRITATRKKITIHKEPKNQNKNNKIHTNLMICLNSLEIDFRSLSFSESVCELVFQPIK